MDYDLHACLAASNKRIAEFSLYIIRQENIVAELISDCHDDAAATAIDLLTVFCDSLRLARLHHGQLMDLIAEQRSMHS